MDTPQMNTRRTCDIVMKGGITSGVVYPKAIARLSKRFDFKNLGGTSAGAIAAAAAAAAEYQRVLTGSDAGFVLVDSLGEELATPARNTSNTMLFTLFAPNNSTKRVFEVATGLIGDGPLWKKILVTLSMAVRRYLIPALIGMAPGATLAGLSFYWSEINRLSWMWVSVGILIAILGSLGAVVLLFAYEFVIKIPANKFGLCSGMPDAGLSQAPVNAPLTVWLNGYLNKVAGINGNQPLTFGNLWDPKGEHQQTDIRDVNLEMMTTNLTHGRPYRLPFRDDEDLKENHFFYFRKDEFELLFPDPVVDWMMKNPRAILPGTDLDGVRALERAERANEGYFPLPDPTNLPVVVATRMSLSFPVLLSAIPLHAIDYTIKKEYQRLERCWFTDGGVCSNFPLHFFDSPLPRRPTFSIDLSTKPDDTKKEDLIPEMDDTNGFSPMDRWNRFDLNVVADASKSYEEKGSIGKLLGFAGTLISTMQNWNDATQSRLPGYRDRIARIPLKSTQGGLNLNMPPKLVAILSEQGEKCAEKLIEHFDVPAQHQKMTWENHRWIRMRSMLASIEKMIHDTLIACDKPEKGDAGYEDWLNDLYQDLTGKYEALSYSPTKDQIKASLETIDKMRTIQAIWHKSGTAAKGSPRPRPIMRPRAQT